jgi:hypothetical protein
LTSTEPARAATLPANDATSSNPAATRNEDRRDLIG